MSGEFGGLRRALAMIGAVVLLTLGTVVVASPAKACACGGVVAAEGESIEVGHEAAAVAWDGQVEDIVLQMDMTASTDDAAVIIPTPADPEVQPADPDFFADLREMAAPRQDVNYTWWPTSQSEEQDAAGGAQAAHDLEGDETDAGGRFSAGESVDLDNLQTKVFAAADVDELTEWLRDRHYVMSDAMASAMTPYVSEGWYFVAIHLRSGGDSLTGALQPIHLSFESNSLIYPMRMSTAAHTAQDVTTYVIADSQVRRTDPTATSTAATLQFAGPLETDLQRSRTWGELAAAGDYLTVINQHFANPSAQILSDFTFAGSPGAPDYQQVVQVTKLRQILGLPAGPVLVVLILLLAAAPLGYTLLRRPSRRDGVLPVRQHRRSRGDAASVGH